jgi:outer membrane protein, heavy metal efflux system
VRDKTWERAASAGASVAAGTPHHPAARHPSVVAEADCFSDDRTIRARWRDANHAMICFECCTEGVGQLRILIPLLFISVALAGCQTYTPRALDLEAHASQWRERRADDSSVRAYIDSLERVADDQPVLETDFVPTAGMDLHHAEWVALLYNPELRRERADQDVARAIADHAGMWDDPVIGLDLLRTLSSAANPWTIGSSVSFTLPLSGRLARERLLAAAELDVAILRVVERERDVLKQLRQLWLQWSVLNQRIALIDDLLVDLESITATANRLAEHGEMLRTETALFEIERTSRSIERDLLIERKRIAEEEIRSVMGLSPEAPVRPKPQLSFATDHVDGDFHDPSDLALINPELARLRAAYTATEERLHREVRKQYPDLTLGPQYESDEGQSRIGFITGVPLPILNANRQGIAEAEAARELARAEFETAYEQVVGQVAVLKRRIDAARFEHEQVESRLAPLVDRQVNDARQLLELGEGSPLALLEGLVRRHEAKLRILDAVAMESEAAIELARLHSDRAFHQQNQSLRQEAQQ